MVIIVGSRVGYLSSNLDKVVCISHSTNAIGKCMNPTTLSVGMAK